MKVPFTLETMGDLGNGAVRLMVNQAIRNVVADLDDRGDDGAKRSITISIDLSSKGGLIVVSPQVKTTLPAWRAPNTAAERVYIEGELAIAFQRDNAARPDQPTFHALDDKDSPSE